MEKTAGNTSSLGSDAPCQGVIKCALSCVTLYVPRMRGEEDREIWVTRQLFETSWEVSLVTQTFALLVFSSILPT